MATFDEDELSLCLSEVLLKEDLDDDLITYLVGMICDGDTVTLSEVASATIDEESEIYEAIGPFLESSGCESDIIMKACSAVQELAKKSAPSSGTSSARNHMKLSQGAITMSSNLDRTTEEEEDANRFLWGTDTALKNTNMQRDAHDNTTSTKDKRKQKQELEKARKEYTAKMEALEREEAKEGSNAVVSVMVLPDYDSGRNEKDIHCRNVGLSLDTGRILLDNADLKFANQVRMLHACMHACMHAAGHGTLFQCFSCACVNSISISHVLLFPHVTRSFHLYNSAVMVLWGRMELAKLRF